MPRRPATMFLQQTNGTYREFYIADSTPVVGIEERVSVAPSGESWAVYRHTDHVLRQIGRVYRTHATGNRRWQGVDMAYREVVRAGTLQAAAIFMHSRSMEG